MAYLQELIKNGSIQRELRVVALCVDVLMRGSEVQRGGDRNVNVQVEEDLKLSPTYRGTYFYAT